MPVRWISWTLLCLAISSGPLAATDTAFWKPYQDDANTYALFHFQPDPAGAEGTAAIDRADLTGDAALDPAGKFGQALRVRGQGALRAVPKAIFPGGYVSIEAWIKLEKYPEKTAAIVCRPAVVDGEPRYNPEVDLTKGFALLVDSRGALHLETVNCEYGRTTRTSSPEGVVPRGQWVHVAGLSDTFPIAFRRLYVNGREVAATPIAWGEGLMVGGDEERKPGAIYLGNNDRGDAGLDGWIDEVRIHRKIARFWQRDDAWPAPAGGKPVPDGPPYFLASHPPLLHLPLDGSLKPAVCRIPGLKVEAGGERYLPGVRGQACLGPIRLSAERLLDLGEGSIEFWLQPVGVHNLADNNRGFVDGPFVLYFLNDGGGLGLKPMTLYFSTPGGLHFLHDALETEFHPGAWYHLVTTWKDRTIALYINGRQAGKTFDRSLASRENKGRCGQLQLSPHEPIGLVDEVRLYDKALLPEESANAFFRYRDPTKLTAGVRARSVELKAQYFPSQNAIDYQCVPETPPGKDARVRLVLSRQETGAVGRLSQAVQDGLGNPSHEGSATKTSPSVPGHEAGQELLRRDVPWSAGEQRLSVAELGDGQYALTAALLRPDDTAETPDRFEFVRKHFPWEKNTLGIGDEIYPPFEPIQIEGNRASVVGRQLTMNGFGLWDQAVSLGRPLLAAPIRLRFTTAAGEGAWSKTEGRWLVRKPNAAVYSAEASADALRVRTTSTLEIDGCMKVEMELSPGAKPVEVGSLWIEVPLRADQTPLMHTIGDGLRQNYAGWTPAGEGVVWDGSRAARSGPWRNCFVPYVWLGGEERGLAWFGENDKGWITEKEKSKRPTHELRREGAAAVLRVYLINRPATLTGPRRLVFGLQASPTKPLPADWRSRLPHIPGGLAVVPFGGLQCASQGPFRDDWQVVDKLLECRGGKPLDAAWFDAYVKKHRPPLVHGTWDWLNSVGHFASRARDVGPGRPLTVYQEEMSAAASRAEWGVFQDEWNAAPYDYARTRPDPRVWTEGHVTLGAPVGVTFGPSYRDFGCWFADQWLRRGVSLYWDNTYPHLATNFRTTDAYLAEDGEIQPCLILWNQREYQKRVWRLLQEWRARRPEPLEWVLHMTNTLVLPIHTWGTADLDHELGSDKPFAPDWLRTETIGRQIGNLPLSLYAVAGSENKVFAALAARLPKKELDRLRDRAEWGMRTVHEIQHTGPLEKHLTDFGYGTDPVEVHNYWEEKPLLSVRPDTIKWLVLSNRPQRTRLIVLASWSESDILAEVSLEAGAKATDAETGEPLAVKPTGELAVKLPGPYGVRLVRVVLDFAKNR